MKAYIVSLFQGQIVVLSCPNRDPNAEPRIPNTKLTLNPIYPGSGNTRTWSKGRLSIVTQGRHKDQSRNQAHAPTELSKEISSGPSTRRALLFAQKPWTSGACDEEDID
ncbi:hypothetical protein ElyMa_004898100 [Elysia marginata]|uniref:Uncharacterized protein n=1 Tax=Elysia marginata TaxID=1093978 RepID=A0AAV4IUJ4_9GAST|nr:hypothetical protein ElyMa_004898100 [Elysia marginata]